MVGEENEYDWARMAHLVASGRVSSAPRRSQKIDSYALFTSRRFKERMGGILSQRYKKALEVETENQEILTNTIGVVLPARVLKDGSQRPSIQITLEYLAKQAADQETYYQGYK